jgi:glycosyltransferase involved in cell wall biosynthesis
LPKKKKILFILPNLRAGGAERVLITIANNIDQNKFNSVILVLNNDGDLKELINDNITLYSLNKDRVLFSLFSLYKKIKKISPDVVLSTMFHMNFGILLLKPFLKKVKFFVREANMPSYILEQHHSKNISIKLAYKLLYPMADVILSPAKIIRDELSDIIKIPDNKFVVIHNPVDTEHIKKSLGEVKVVEENKVQKFVASGRLNYQKGFDRLIQMLGENSLPYEWSLTILGDGGDFDYLNSLIKQYHLKNNISLVGYQKNPWKYYQSADVFLLPSRSEGLPNVVLESLFCGTRVIAMAEAGGIQEIADFSSGGVSVCESEQEFLLEIKKIPENKNNNVILPDVFYQQNILKKYEDNFIKILSSKLN